MLRSMRLGEADRILHLYTHERGRIGAVAKGIRKTKSRFGARLEPLSHVAMQLHQGSGELQTVTGVDLISSHSAVREDPYRLGVGLIGAEAMLRLFTEQEKNERAFTALAKFLDVLDGDRAAAVSPRASTRSRLSFQLKLLWLSGYLPHLTSCAECGAEDVPLVGYSPKAGGAVCRACAQGALPLSPAGIDGIEQLLGRPALRGACDGPHRPRGARRPARRHRELRVPRRLPPANPLRVKRDLGDGYELDDDLERIDRRAVHAFLANDAYWAEGPLPRDAGPADRRGSARRRPLPRRRRRRLHAHVIRRDLVRVPRRRLRPPRTSRPRARARARRVSASTRVPTPGASGCCTPRTRMTSIARPGSPSRTTRCMERRPDG